MRFVVLACVGLIACGGSKSSTTTTPPPTDNGGGTGAPLTTKDVEGYWSGDWGQLVFREKDGKMIAAYSHDDGTIVGTLQGDKLVGWWCEAPSRQPDADAGDVEMKFITVDGKRKIDGRWRYGSTSESWDENWDIEFGEGQPDEALVKRFDDASAFCTKPSGSN